jgi:hypothetical protein
MWVATEYAQALGYRVRPLAEADQSTQPQRIAAATATMTAPGGQAMPTPPPAQAPGAQAPQAPPGQSWQSAQPPGQSWPPGAQAPQGPPGQSWPPAQPSSGRPPTPGNGRKRGLIAAAAAAGLVVVCLIVAAVAHTVPFGKPHPIALPTPTPVKTTHPPTASPKPTLAAGVTPLSQLLPGDINDPTTQCSAIKKPEWSSPGLVSALSCNDPGLPGGYVNGYQMDSRANFDATWRNFNAWSSFDESKAGSSCPAASSAGQGITPWNGKGFPSMQGQVLECWTGSNAAPIYVWTMPSQDAFFIAVGANGSSMKALDTWWINNSAPATAPKAVPSPQAS